MPSKPIQTIREERTSLQKKIEKLYEKYRHLDNDMVHRMAFPVAMQELATWIITQYRQELIQEIEALKEQSDDTSLEMDYYDGAINKVISILTRE